MPILDRSDLGRPFLGLLGFRRSRSSTSAHRSDDADQRPASERRFRVNGVIFPGDDPDSLIATLKALTRDIQRIRAGAAPTAADLEAAPVLHGWAPAVRGSTCLVGSVHAHPLLGARRAIFTSEVYAIDELRGWARTYSRFYVLGAKSEEQERHHA
jgi:hypothetical protein